MRLAVAVLLLAGCHSRPPGIAVAQSAEVGVVPQSGLIQGHDGASSAMLFGHSVWLYGDTPLTVADAAGETWHTNSFAVTDDLDASDGLSGFRERLDAAGAPLQLIANTAEEAAFNQAHRGDPCAAAPCGAPGCRPGGVRRRPRPDRVPAGRAVGGSVRRAALQ